MVQQELADKLGRSQSFVAKVERGARRIDVIEFTPLSWPLVLAIRNDYLTRALRHQLQSW
jgi:transcriptional regulator with XRE-family HTH domain